MSNRKNLDEQNSGFWCGCKNSTMIDYGDGETVCQKCGVVLADDRVERENIVVDQTQDSVHHSGADYTKSNRGLGETFGTRNELKKIGIESYKDHRLTNLGHSDEVKCNDVFQEIENICKKQRHSKTVNEAACREYKRNIEKHGFQKYKNNKILAGTCVLRTCKNSKIRVNINNMSEIIDQPRDKLVKCYNDIHKKISMEKPNLLTNPAFDRTKRILLHIQKMASSLEIPEKIIRENLVIFDNERFELIISGSDDRSISAGKIEFICRHNNLKLKTKKIAKKYEMSENTVRKQAQKISEVLNVELGDRRRKRC